MPVVGAIAGVGSALIGASSAKKAANAQSKAADQQYQLQKDIYDDTKGRFQPYEQAGNLGLQAYLYEMGLGNAPTIGGTAPKIQTITTPATTTTGGASGTGFAAPFTFGIGREGRDEARYAARQSTTTPGSTTYRVGNNDFTTLEEAQAWANANPTGGTAYGGFTATPGYDFRVQQGTDAVNALAGARGGLVSGRTMQDLTSFGQGIAAEEHGNYMDRLAGITDMGQASAANTASAGNAYASGASAALGAKGNAQAAGYIGVGNALNSGIQSGVGVLNYQNMLNQGYTPQGWTK